MTPKALENREEIAYGDWELVTRERSFSETTTANFQFPIREER